MDSKEFIFPSWTFTELAFSYKIKSIMLIKIRALYKLKTRLYKKKNKFGTLLS